MNYIIINSNQVANFTGKAKRNGVELNWKVIQPIAVFLPQNKSVLNADLLNDEDIKEAFPFLDNLPQANESEIEFFEYDINRNVLN